MILMRTSVALLIWLKKRVRNASQNSNLFGFVSIQRQELMNDFEYIYVHIYKHMCVYIYIYVYVYYHTHIQPLNELLNEVLL